MITTNNINADSDTGIAEDKYLLLGDYYLVKLDEYVPDEGLINLKYSKYTSDSGREAAALDSFTYLPKGTIVQIGTQATNPDRLSIGDRVFIAPSALTPHYQFFAERNATTIEFKGLIKVSLPHIEAKIID